MQRKKTQIRFLSLICNWVLAGSLSAINELSHHTGSQEKSGMNGFYRQIHLLWSHIQLLKGIFPLIRWCSKRWNIISSAAFVLVCSLVPTHKKLDLV